MALETLYKFYTALDSLVLSRQLGSIADYGICSWGIDKPKIDGSNTLVLSAGTSFLVKGYSDDNTIGESLQTTLFKVTETATTDPIFSCAGQKEPCLIALEYKYVAAVDYGPQFVWCYLTKKKSDQTDRLNGYEPDEWVARFKNKTLIPLGRFIPPKDTTSDVGTLYTEGYALYAKEYFKTTLPYYFRYTVRNDVNESISSNKVSLYYGSELVTTKSVLQKSSATAVSWKTLSISSLLDYINISELSTSTSNRYAGFGYKVDAFRFPSSSTSTANPEIVIDMGTDPVTTPHSFSKDGYIYIADLYYNSTDPSHLLGLTSIFYSDFISFLPGGGAFDVKDSSDNDVTTEYSGWSTDFQTLNLRLKLNDGVVGTANLSNGSITADKLISNPMNLQTLPLNWIVPTARLQGSITSDIMASLSVNERVLADNAVTTAKLANGAVTESKLADSAVTEAKLDDASVTTDKIKQSNVTVDKMTFTAPSDFSPTTGKIWIS